MQFFIFSASLQQSFQLKYGTIHFMWHDVATSKKKVLQNNEIAIDSELSEASVNDNGHETRGEKWKWYYMKGFYQRMNVVDENSI